MAPMQPNSGLAAVAFWTSSVRLYYQDTNGDIIEAGTDDPVNTGWMAGGPIGVKAKLGSPLAAVAWDDSNIQIRVFYIDTNNILSEHSYRFGVGWKAGTLQQQSITMNSFSLAACTLANAMIRLYYLPSNDMGLPLQEMTGDGTNWSTGAQIVLSRLRSQEGCPLSAVAWRDTQNHIRVYYGGDLNFNAQVTFDSPGEWKQGPGAGGRATLKQTAAISFPAASARSSVLFCNEILRGPNGDVNVSMLTHTANANAVNPDWKTSEWLSNMSPRVAPVGSIYDRPSVAAVTWVGAADQKRYIIYFLQGTKDEIGWWFNEGVESPTMEYWQYQGGIPMRP